MTPPAPCRFDFSRPDGSSGGSQRRGTRLLPEAAHAAARGSRDAGAAARRSSVTPEALSAGCVQVATEDALHTALDNTALFNITITKSLTLTGLHAFDDSTHFLLGAPGQHLRVEGLCDEEGTPTITLSASGTSRRIFTLAHGSSVTLKCLILENVRLPAPVPPGLPQTIMGVG